MTTFKPGDKVRVNPTQENITYFRANAPGVSIQDPFTVKEQRGYLLSCEELAQRHYADRFYLVSPPVAEKPRQLLTVLQMDRAIAAAGGTPSVLEEYLDRPLSDFIQNVMAPNSLTLKYK